jgi:hypothetical protein
MKDLAPWKIHGVGDCLRTPQDIVRQGRHCLVFGHNEHPLAEVSHLGLLRRWVDFARFGDRKGSVWHSRCGKIYYKTNRKKLQTLKKIANLKDT